MLKSRAAADRPIIQLTKAERAVKTPTEEELPSPTCDVRPVTYDVGDHEGHSSYELAEQPGEGRRL
jgi:hypothetical protein